MIKDVEHLSYLRRLGQLELVSLKKRTLISNYKDGTRLFSVVYEAQRRKIYLNINFFTVMAVQH